MRGSHEVRKLFIVRKLDTEKNIGRIWILVVVVALAIIIIWKGDSLKAMEIKSDQTPFLTALTQLGVLYIFVLFVERALEFLIKAWRQGGKACLAQGAGSEETRVQKKLEEYKGEHRDGHFSLG